MTHQPNKSWVELCEESSTSNSIDVGKTSAQSEVTQYLYETAAKETQRAGDQQNTDHVSCATQNEGKDAQIKDGGSEVNFAVTNPPPWTKTETSTSSLNNTLEEGEIRDSTLELDTSIDQDNVSEKNKIAHILTYAKVLSKGAKTECNERKRLANVPTDELSLTSHLDVFHVDSPRKEVPNTSDDAEIELFVDENTVMFSPVKKEEHPVKNMKRPFMLIDSPVQSKREKHNVENINKVAKSQLDSDVHTVDGASPSSKRELEVNPDVLSRRQKQIDYGKNTVGYERYSQLIPKTERTKNHPKTPPKHLKMSRRAWDGLIKNWRVKLHKYDDDFDMESINCDNDQYSFSDEVSSYDSSSMKSDSTPTTPVPGSGNADKADEDLWMREDRSYKPENSKELWPNGPQSQKSDKSDEDDYLGCESLNENCVKACS